VKAVALFIQNRFAAGAWTVTPGVRFEQIDYFRRNNLTGISGTADASEVIPGLGVTYSMAGDTVFFAGAHRGFAPPASRTSSRTPVAAWIWSRSFHGTMSWASAAPCDPA
jgi:Fe(3+) dicitrate transport protein